MKCRKLGKVVVSQSKTLKNLIEAAGSRDTVLMDVDVQARKLEIEQTQQMLQESQKAHGKAIAKTYKQLRNTSCPVMHSPNEITSARRCTSVTCGLE